MSGFADGAVVAGIDGSPSAARAAGWAGAEAVHRGRPLRLVQVYALPQVNAPLAFGTGEQVRAGRGLLGSTSQALIAHSPCPVAVVRPQRSGSVRPLWTSRREGT